MNTPFKNLKVMVVRHQDDKIQTVVPKQKSDTFHRVSVKIATKLGSAWAFYIAVLAIVIWIISGPVFNFSNTWQLVINTGTTIVTFLMVFVIQNTQNRDGRAMQIKLDELIHSHRAARTEFVDIEDLSDSELDLLQQQFKDIHEKIQTRKK